MATSPTPSLDSIRGTNSIESYSENNGYLSDSPLTLSGSSPPVSDSAICDDFVTNGASAANVLIENKHHPISASVSSSSSSTSSGISGCSGSGSGSGSGSSSSSGSGSGSSSTSSCNGGETGIIYGNSGKGSPCNGILSTNNIISVAVTDASNNNAAAAAVSTTSPPRCTACKSKQSDAVAKCFECVNFLCSNCVTAHEFMHCFNGHNVFLINGFESLNAKNNLNVATSSTIQQQQQQQTTTVSGGGVVTNDYKLSSSLSVMLQQQQQELQKHNGGGSHLSRIALNATSSCGFKNEQSQQQQQQQQHQHQQKEDIFPKLPISNDLLPTLTPSLMTSNNGGGSNSNNSNNTNGSGGNNNNNNNNGATITTTVASATSNSSNSINSINSNSNSNNNNNNNSSSIIINNNNNTNNNNNNNNINKSNKSISGSSTNHLLCNRHKNELLKFFCRTCSMLACKDCITLEHPSSMHEVELSHESAKQHLNLQQLSQTQLSENLIQTILAELRGKVGEIVSLISNWDTNASKIKMQYQKAHNEITETYQFFCSMLDERKQEMLKELEGLYNAKITTSTLSINRSKDLIDQVLQSCDSIERSPKLHNISDILMLHKTLDLQHQSWLQDIQLPFELEFVSNYQSIQTGVRNMFGYIRASTESTSILQKQPPIARPIQGTTNASSSSSSSSSSHGATVNIINAGGGGNNMNIVSNLLDNTGGGGGGGGGYTTTTSGSSSSSGSVALSCHNGHLVGFDTNFIAKRYQNNATTAMLNNSQLSNSSSKLLAGNFINDVGGGGSGGGGGGGSIHLNPYEKWSNGGTDNCFSNLNDHQYPITLSSAAVVGGNTLNCNNNSMNALVVNSNNVGGGGGGNGNNVVVGPSLGGNGLNTLTVVGGGGGGGGGINSSCDSIIDLTSKLLSAATIYPPKSQIKRQKMIYHCKFGEFGVMEGQFTEPSGVAVNAQNDIIVADTNNHRIQIFDKEGRFKFQFGECGKRDSQLLYPNRVAVVKTSGDIIVTERSPTHQIQIYNQYGQFVRKFGANILQHPRGVTVDNKGRIIVVECKVMRVIIFDQNGNVIQKFGCSKHLEFPNGVIVNDKQEIFISDNRAHCVKVFNYEGQYLRQIGGEGVTNYPIGVGINLNGEILIADNHNNFNLTIFTQDGQMVSALESKVKHAQCFDVALMDDGSVVLASKDYRLYIYRYVQVPPIGL